MFTCHAPFSVAALASLVSIPWQSFTNANLECYAYGQMFTGVQTRLGKIWRNILPVLPRYLTCSTIRWRIIVIIHTYTQYYAFSPFSGTNLVNPSTHLNLCYSRKAQIKCLTVRHLPFDQVNSNLVR